VDEGRGIDMVNERRVGRKQGRKSNAVHGIGTRAPERKVDIDAY